MEGVGWQIGMLVVVFLLVIILGLQIQISGLYRDMDELRGKQNSG